MSFLFWGGGCFRYSRGTIGTGEVLEALTEPAKAKNFATRIDELIGKAKTNERVRAAKLRFQVHATRWRARPASHERPLVGEPGGVGRVRL